MKQENIDTLQKHYHHWVTLRDAGYIRGLNNHEKDDIIRVARDEFFGPNYSPDMWCSTCIIEAVKQIYTQYEKRLL